MEDRRDKQIIQQVFDSSLSGIQDDPWMAQRVLNKAHESPETGGVIVKKKISAGLIFAIVLMLAMVTAVAAVLLTHTEIIEQFAVPMAQRNDTDAYTQESYTHEELVQLIHTLNENGISLDEDSTIMKALKNGQGYWEEEVLMAICREAFDGNFSTWSIEEKHWFENMTVQIGFKEKNPYRVPGQGDMTVPEAKAHAAKLLNNEYGVELPVESDEKWMIWEWFYEAWTDMDGFHPAEWKFEYINRITSVQEYNVSFDQQGNLLEIQEAGFHGEMPEFDSFNMADRYFSDKYGAMSNWPLEAWAEFGEAIAALEPESANQWCYINAGYRLPPEGSISSEQAIGIAAERVALVGDTDTQIICCTSNGQPIYKVRLSVHFPGNETNATYDAVWCLELDCMTAEILDMWEYTYGPDSKPIRMYVPFSIQESAPSFKKPVTSEDPAKLAEKERQARAYETYRQQYGETWFFWPLEAQKDALGGHYHVPVQGEMTRDEAVDMALKAIEAKHGKEALTQLGDYQIGAICCLYDEPEGLRYSWELYITSDPEFLSNGFRVNIVVFEGMLDQPEVEVQRANVENG